MLPGKVKDGCYNIAIYNIPDKTFTIIKKDDFPKEFKAVDDMRADGENWFWDYHNEGYYLYLYPCGGNLLLRYDYDSKKMSGTEIKLTTQQIINEIIPRYGKYMEEEKCSGDLDVFLTYNVNSNEKSIFKDSSKESYGLKIYKEMLRRLT